MFTQVLDILEKVMSMYKIKFVRLDGSTQVEERQTLIDTFYDDDEIPVFLLSTKAGGFGINLVAANNVIIFDQSFNPHDDKQAEDRAHRVGQTKDVNVYRLISENTCEESVLQMAFEKLQLDQSMMKAQVDFEDDDVAKLMESVLFSKEQEEKVNAGEGDEAQDDDEGFKYENPDAVTAVIAATEEEVTAITEIPGVDEEVLVDEHGRPKRRSAAVRKLTDAEIYGLSDQELEGEGEIDPEFNVSSVNMEDGDSLFLMGPMLR
ncbi:unnamed protein product [Ambrosiozyma monospora]|uniref:Unnamed protein product n=1 Tax=Ambrosiozyma monospora TaxID=43982 RepID=A0A9W6T4Q0_AMBMO|nr:unnamed protein product [Ambrosiozyma monospora]